jgi:predicted secreted protein
MVVKLPMTLGALFGAATWFLLFVILGIGLGTAFIAGGSVLAAGVLAGALASVPGRRPVLDARLTSTGLVFGIATFVVLEVVLSSVPLWVGVVAALTVIGAYDMIDATFREGAVEPQAHGPQPASAPRYDGHDRTREPVMAR